MENVKKCWVCRVELEDKSALFCDQCAGKENKATAPTLVIYDKI